jgi:hypothetical protein
MSGQMAGAQEFRFGYKIPVPKVPLRQAALLAYVHVAPLFPGTRGGRLPDQDVGQGPIFISGLALVRFINAMNLIVYLNTRNPTVVAHFEMSSNRVDIHELVGMLLVSVLLEHRLEHPIDVKMQPPERPEVGILARHQYKQDSGLMRFRQAAAPSFELAKDPPQGQC